MSQIANTANPTRKAPTTPVTRDRNVTARIKPSMGTVCLLMKRPVIGDHRPLPLLDCQGFVDQLLAVRNFLGEFRERAFLGEGHPGVKFVVGECDDLVLVV